MLCYVMLCYVIYNLQPQYTFDPAYKNPCWREDGQLKCLPYFFLIGIKKSGTTDLFVRLLHHPEVAVPGPFLKEARWFATYRFGEFAYNMYRIRSNYCTYPNKRIDKQLRILQITASVLLSPSL